MRTVGSAENEQTLIIGDAVDVGFKLRSALEIAFDINAH